MAPNKVPLGLQVGATGLHPRPKPPLLVHLPVSHNRHLSGATPSPPAGAPENRGKKHHTHPFGHPHPPRHMPPRPVQNHQQKLPLPRPPQPGKVPQDLRESLGVHRGQRPKLALPHIRTHETVHVGHGWSPYLTHRYRGHTQARCAFPRGAHTPGTPVSGPPKAPGQARGKGASGGCFAVRRTARGR